MATPAPETAIWVALKARMASLTLSPVLPVAFTNESFTPPSSGTPERPGNYLAVQHLKNDPDVATLGSTGKTRHRGIFQIMLHCRKNQDFAVATEIAGDVADHFKLGTAMTSSGVTVRVEAPPSVGSDISDADEPLMQIPISIRWSADANRS